MRTTLIHIMQFLLAAIVVVALGGLAGWYFFVTKQIDKTVAQDTARSFGEAPSFAQSLGSTYQNIVEGFSQGLQLGEGKSEEDAAAPRLWQVTKNPVAGMGFASSTTELLFAERATGNILRADPSFSSVTRLTNTLIPKVYDTLFSPRGDVILRSSSDEGNILSYSGALGTSTPSGTEDPVVLTGVYLPQNITAITRDGMGIIYLVRNPAGGVVAASASWTGSAQKKLFESPLENWRLYTTQGHVLMVQKASDDINGFALTVNPDGSLTTLLSNVPGLTVLPNETSSAYLYGQSTNGTLSLYAVAGSGANPIRLPIRTIADKCVWKRGGEPIAYCAVPQSAPSGSFLLDWYRGALHTSDTLWQVNVAAATAEQIYIPSDIELDVHNPVIDAHGLYVSFINGTDSTLWMLRLAQ